MILKNYVEGRRKKEEGRRKKEEEIHNNLFSDRYFTFKVDLLNDQ